MRESIVVAGALANKPLSGGEAWVRLSWIRGLRRLGFHVEFIEQIHPATLIGPDGAVAPLEESVNADYFRRITRSFGLDDVATLIVEGRSDTIGRPRGELRDLALDAALLVNISGHLSAPWLKPLFRRRAYIDIDPGFTQYWLAQGVAGHRIADHELLYTIAENIGRPGCGIPTCDLPWRTVRQPVVLEDWPVAPPPDSDARFTTVSSWRGAFGPIEHEGGRFGVKAHEFRKIRDLPLSVPVPLEIALDIHPTDDADLKALRKAGWGVVDPRAVVPDPESFRDYVNGSAGEFSVAQAIYVETRSGWFSDRTTRYLAAGRPAVVQDTGFGATIPAGVGLHAFRTPDEAGAALRRVRDDYRAESRAARRLAERFFDSDRVLASFVDDALSARPLAGDRPSPGKPRPSGRGERLRILVAGRVAAAPDQGGAAWAVLQYLLGLRELGHEVHFLEPLSPQSLTPAHARLAGSANARYFREVMTAFGLQESAALWLEGSQQVIGAPHATIRRWASEADLVINLSGVLSDEALLGNVPVRLYLDMDPAFTQLWHADEGIDMGFDRHTHHATVGLALAAGKTDLPTCGVRWLPTLPPVVLGAWPRARRTVHHAATTVANWRAYGSIERDGVLYGQKAHSLRRFMRLPTRTAARLRVALSIHPDEKGDLESLKRNGWELVDPATLARTPATYAEFVSGSLLELGVAKSGYVESACGWVSDRSACYLAAGRPVLAQETGLSRHLPTGTGLLAFSTEDEAVAGLEEIRSGYDRHAAAAREVAEELFDSRKVLSRLVEAVGGTT